MGRSKPIKSRFLERFASYEMQHEHGKHIGPLHSAHVCTRLIFQNGGQIGENILYVWKLVLTSLNISKNTYRGLTYVWIFNSHHEFFYKFSIYESPLLYSQRSKAPYILYRALRYQVCSDTYCFLTQSGHPVSKWALFIISYGYLAIWNYVRAFSSLSKEHRF